MYRVREMSTEDFDFAVHLTDTMGWQLTNEDFEFMLQLEPEGCFVLVQNCERVGILTSISLDSIGWIGNVIVSESHRKKGAGSLLMKHAVNYLSNKNVKTVGLYAYLDSIPFYERLGFTYDSDFLVLHGKGFSSSTKANAKKVKKKDLPEIFDYDKSCFGASRRKLLEPILLNTDNLCYVSVKDGKILGYAAAKVYQTVAEIGPLVCQNGQSDIATDLLKSILNRLNGFDLSAYIPKKETEVHNFLLNSGFRESFHVARMFLGAPALGDCIYMAESAERG